MAQQSNQASIAEAQAQLQYLYNLYTQQHSMLENEIGTLTLTTAAINRNIEMLENKERLSGSRILINGEGGAYLSATLDQMDRVLVYIGAGYMLEKSTDQAMEYLKSAKMKQDEAIRKLSADRQRVGKEIVSVSYNLSQLQADQSRR